MLPPTTNDLAPPSGEPPSGPAAPVPPVAPCPWPPAPPVAVCPPAPPCPVVLCPPAPPVWPEAPPVLAIMPLAPPVPAPPPDDPPQPMPATSAPTSPADSPIFMAATLGASAHSLSQCTVIFSHVGPQRLVRQRSFGPCLAASSSRATQGPNCTTTATDTTSYWARPASIPVTNTASLRARPSTNYVDHQPTFEIARRPRQRWCKGPDCRDVTVGTLWHSLLLASRHRWNPLGS